MNDPPRASSLRTTRLPALPWWFLARWQGLTFFLLACCGGEPPEPSAPPAQPLILVGVDGLEWNLLLPFARDGDLPTFVELMRRGRFGRLAAFPSELAYTDVNPKETSCAAS